MNSLLNLIPWPEKITMKKGCLSFNSIIRIALPKDADDSWKTRANIFEEKLRQRFSVAAETFIRSGESEAGCSIFVECSVGHEQISGNSNSDEAYTLSVGEIIHILTNTHSGLHNAFMTLLQLFSQNGNSVIAPRVDIEDRPRFHWRGTLIDCRSALSNDISIVSRSSNLTSCTGTWSMTRDGASKARYFRNCTRKGAKGDTIPRRRSVRSSPMQKTAMS
jgi:N-acetyl-beta-hexosaminidase